MSWNSNEYERLQCTDWSPIVAETNDGVTGSIWNSLVDLYGAIKFCIFWPWPFRHAVWTNTELARNSRKAQCTHNLINAIALLMQIIHSIQSEAMDCCDTIVYAFHCNSVDTALPLLSNFMNIKPNLVTDIPHASNCTSRIWVIFVHSFMPRPADIREHPTTPIWYDRNV